MLEKITDAIKLRMSDTDQLTYTDRRGRYHTWMIKHVHQNYLTWVVVRSAAPDEVYEMKVGGADAQDEHSWHGVPISVLPVKLKSFLRRKKPL